MTHMFKKCIIGGVNMKKTSNKNEIKLENASNFVITNLSDKEILEKSNQYKNNVTISMCIISLVTFIIFAILLSCLIIFFKKTPEFINLFVFSIISATIIIIFPFIVLIYFKLNTSRLDLAILQIKKDNKHKIKRPTNEIVNNGLNDYKIIRILDKRLKITKLIVDNTSQKFALQNGTKLSKIYEFSQLINYEVYENGSSKVKGTAGKALIGGAFFGLGGLILGSSMSKQINENCNQLKLIIRVNDSENPQMEITYLKNVNLDKSGKIYRNIKTNLQEVCSILEYILNKKTIEQYKNINYEMHQVEKTNKEQLKELKEMLEEGLITQEDFDKKKKQILDI